MEVSLDAQVGVSCAAGRLVSCSSVDGEIGRIHINFKVVGEAIVEFEVRGILPQVGYLKLKSVIFIEELEVPLSALGDPSVIGIKGQLRMERPTDAEHAGQQRKNRHKTTDGLNFQNGGTQWLATPMTWSRVQM